MPKRRWRLSCRSERLEGRAARGDSFGQTLITITRNTGSGGGYVLETEMVLASPLEEVFDFFADATNLKRITPPWLQFRVLTPGPIEMFTGQLIDYRLKLHGVPIRWRTEIASWDPPHEFCDTQLRGPYRLWRHQHYFEEVAGGTRCRDVVYYRVPGGPLIHWLLVRRDVETIFTYRAKVLRELFGSASTLQPA